MAEKLRFGFCGSGRFAAECLSIITQKTMPEWVVTNAPRPSGRGLHLQNTPVFDKAEELGIITRTTSKLSADTETIEWIMSYLPDLILVIDFGHMIKEPLLSMAPLGCINIHPSMLPAYRGSAPVQRAIMDGLKETGVTIFRLDEGMDSGPILSQIPVIISDEDDTGSLLLKTCRAGCVKLLEYLLDIPAERWTFVAQTEDGASTAPKIDKSEGKIEWKDSSINLFNRIRALWIAPGTYCDHDGKRLRIHKAVPASGSGSPGKLIETDDGFPVIACGSGSLKLMTVQPEGKKVQKADEWLRGSRMKVGDILH
ncbi:MAG: methionyl-tRNA formyltransferase [Synergistaceae bacterium]|nr:methionyl-tRNA formyltransferase [Synergistaceae bacterium]